MTRTNSDMQRDAASLVQLAVQIQQQLVACLKLLADLQPGYPSGTTGPGQRNAVSDPVGELATGRAATDPARKALDELGSDLHKAEQLMAHAMRIVNAWQPPTGRWRGNLADKAANELANSNDPWCKSCLRVGVLTPPRTTGGNLCRWCQDMARATNLELPPKALVEKHAQGRRITDRDVRRHNPNA